MLRLRPRHAITLVPPDHLKPLATALGLDPAHVEGQRFVEQLWVELPLEAHWLAAVRFALQSGRLVIAELRVFPRETTWRPDRPPGVWSGEILGFLARVPDGGLTAGLLRRLRLQELERQAPVLFRRLRRRFARARVLAPGGEAFFSEGERPRPRRRSGRPDRFYAKLAAEYVRLLPRTRRPVIELARRYRVSQARMRDQLHEARVRGLLTGPGQGRIGGILTPRAERILRKRA